MGFMAGFGESFSRSFEQQRQRSHEKETDAFRYRMETLIKKKSDWDTAKKEYDNNVNLAKELVQIYGAPPEAIGKVSNLLNTGMSKEQVHKLVAEGEFSIDDTVLPEDTQTEQTMVEPAQPQVDAAPNVQAAAPTQPAQQDTSGGLLSQIFPGMKRPSNGLQGRVDARVQETAGMTPEEIAQYDQGFTPEAAPESRGLKYTPKVKADGGPKNLIEANQIVAAAKAALDADPQNPALQKRYEIAKRDLQATAAGVEGAGRAELGIIGQQLVVHNGEAVMGNVTAEGPILDSEGNELPGARIMLKEESDRAQKIRDKVEEQQVKHNESASNLGQAYVALGIVNEIGKENPLVFQKRTSEITRYLVDLGKDIAAGSQLVTDFLRDPEANVSPENLEFLQGEQNKLQALVNDKSLSPEQQLAAARALVNAQYAIAAFHIAAAKGQAGSKMSEAERKLFMDLPELATDYETWKNNIGGILTPMKISIDKQASMAPRASGAEQFNKDYGWKPVGDFDTVDKYLEGTVGADLDRELPQIGRAGVKINVSPDDKASGNEAPLKPEAIPSVTTKEQYDALPPGTQYKHPDGTIKRKK